MSVTAATPDLNPVHTIAEAIRALPRSQGHTGAWHVTITYADGHFAVQEQTLTTQPMCHVEEQIQRVVLILFQQIATLELPAQEAALALLQRDIALIRLYTTPDFGPDALFRQISFVQNTMQYQRRLGEHLTEVRTWLLCPETPPDLAYLQSHSFSNEQRTLLSKLLFLPCLIHNHVQAVQWLLDQGAGMHICIGPYGQGKALLLILLSEKDVTREMAACILQHPRLHEFLPIYMDLSDEQRESFLARLARVWATYPDFEISVHSTSDVGDYWKRFPNSLRLFSDFLRHVSTQGFVRLEYQHHGALRAIPCAAAPTFEQQRRSHGALMRFISDLLGYGQPHSPLDSMAKEDQLFVGRLLAHIVLAHHRASPSLSAMEWRTLLHFHPVQHENFRRNFYIDLANVIVKDPNWRMFSETLFPIAQLGGLYAPWGLIQYQLAQVQRFLPSSPLSRARLPRRLVTTT